MLEQEPTLHRASGTGEPSSGIRDPAATTGSAAQHLVSEVTDEEALQASRSSKQRRLDPDVLDAMRVICSRLQLRPPSSYRGARVSAGERRLRPYRRHSDELDMDRTIEVLLDNAHPSSEDLVVREPEVTRREVVLIVDVSGSMRGDRAKMAAATVGALATQLEADELALIAFWSDAALLKALGEPRSALDMVGELLQLRPGGLTNVAFPLQVARNELSGDPGRERRVILLSDCVHNAGSDPRVMGALLPRLDVLFDTGGENDADMAYDLVRVGRGTLREVRELRDVAEALTVMFEGSPAG